MVDTLYLEDCPIVQGKGKYLNRGNIDPIRIKIS